MRPLLSILLLIAFLLSSCSQSTLSPFPTTSSSATSTISALTPTRTNPPPTRTATAIPPSPSPTPPLPTPTAIPTATSSFTLRQGTPSSLDRPLIAYEAEGIQNKVLRLADPAENAIYEFSFPNAAHFATPFLAGLSPDTHYFVYFMGGETETLYDIEHLRASKPDLLLNILDLRSGEVIFSTPLLSSSYPQDLVSLAETIKDDWTFTNFNVPFDEIVATTQEMLLDYIRNVAWSPDGSLLAYASQVPGPSSDLYFFNPESGSAWRVSEDAAHILNIFWAPDSSSLVTRTSLFSRHAREDTNYLLSRAGTLLASFTSQVWYFRNWHDSTHGLVWGQTDAGDTFELKMLDATDGSISVLWEGSYADIAFIPDLSTFLLSSVMPAPPAPTQAGLYLGKTEDSSLQQLSETRGWSVVYWGSDHFTFAASSMDGGTIGVALDGAYEELDDRYWHLAPSPDGSYLAGYFRYRNGWSTSILPGLRIFDGDGKMLFSNDDIDVSCVQWNSSSSALVYQTENGLYLWEAASGSAYLISNQPNGEDCAFAWVQHAP
jgi:WD40 repeat protein